MKLFSFLFKIIPIIQFKIISFAPRKQNKGRSTGLYIR